MVRNKSLIWIIRSLSFCSEILTTHARFFSNISTLSKSCCLVLYLSTSLSNLSFCWISLSNVSLRSLWLCWRLFSSCLEFFRWQWFSCSSGWPIWWQIKSNLNVEVYIYAIIRQHSCMMITHRMKLRVTTLFHKVYLTLSCRMGYSIKIDLDTFVDNWQPLWILLSGNYPQSRHRTYSVPSNRYIPRTIQQAAKRRGRAVQQQPRLWAGFASAGPWFEVTAEALSKSYLDIEKCAGRKGLNSYASHQALCIKIDYANPSIDFSIYLSILLVTCCIIFINIVCDVIEQNEP